MKRYYLLVASLLCIFMATQGAAKVTWLPDYLGDNKSYGNKRVDNGGKDVVAFACATYGYADSCASPKTGTVVKIAGHDCYKDCKCPSTFKYTILNCAAPAVLSGSSCSEGAATLSFGVELQSASRTATVLETSTNKNLSSGTLPTLKKSISKYTQCVCPDDYVTTKLTNATCESCTVGGATKYKCTCNSGYSLSGGRCVAQCTDYPLTVCPTNGTCSSCPENSGKKRLDSCDTAKGWTKSGNTCVATPCPNGYTAGVTTCTSGSTKPDYSQSGWSGGQPCGMCSCKSINTNCTAANYPVTAIPANATKNTECSTGCGSEKVTRYTFTCNAGYVQSGNTCVKDCSDYTLTSCPDNANCTQCDGKYKMGDCKSGYYKVEDTLTSITYPGLTNTSNSESSSKYSCWSCNGTLLDQTATCPAGTMGVTRVGAVDKICCMTCSDSFNLDACPENAVCNECGGKYNFKKCNEGHYKIVQKSIISNSSSDGKISCEYCNGTLVASSSSCASGYMALFSSGDLKCCVKGNSGTTGGDKVRCPDQSSFDGKHVIYQQLDLNQKSYVAWTSFPLKTGETCAQFKDRIINECGLKADINCSHCICETWGYIQMCNGSMGMSTEGGCSGSGGAITIQ